jgi:hypothetical protein
MTDPRDLDRMADDGGPHSHPFAELATDCPPGERPQAPPPWMVAKPADFGEVPA